MHIVQSIGYTTEPIVRTTIALVKQPSSRKRQNFRIAML